MKECQQNEKSVESFSEYLGRVWNQKGMLDREEKEYGAHSLVNVKDSSVGMISRIFNDFPPPKGSIEELSKIIQFQVNRVFPSLDEDNPMDMEVSETTEEDLRTVWKNVFPSIFKDLLDPLTGEWKTEVEAALKQKYPDYDNWKEAHQENIKIYILFSYIMNVITPYILDNKYGQLSPIKFNSWAKELNYFFEELVGKSKGLKIKDEIKKWSDRYKPFIDCKHPNKILQVVDTFDLVVEAFFDEHENKKDILAACNSSAQSTLPYAMTDFGEYEDETTSSESDDSGCSYIYEILEDDCFQHPPKVKFIFNSIHDKSSKCYCLFNLLKKEGWYGGGGFLLIGKKEMSRFEELLLEKAKEVNDLFSESFSDYLKRVLSQKKQCLSSSGYFFKSLEADKSSKESKSVFLIRGLFVNCPLHLKIIDTLLPAINEKLNKVNLAYSDDEVIKTLLSIFRMLFKEVFDLYSGKLKIEIIKILKENFPMYNSCMLHLGSEGFELNFFESYALQVIVELDLQVSEKTGKDGLFFDRVQAYFGIFSNKPKIKNLIQSWSESNKQKSAIISVKCIYEYIKCFSFEENDLDVSMLLECVISFMKDGCSTELIYDAAKNKNDENEKVESFLETAKNNLEIKQLIVENILSAKPLSLFDQEIIRRVAITPDGQFNSYILAFEKSDRESKILCMCYLYLTEPNWNERVFDCIKAIGGIDDYILQTAFQFEIESREKDCFFVNEVIRMGLSLDNKNSDIAKKIIANTPKELIVKLIHQKEDQGLKDDAEIIWKIYQESLLISSQYSKKG